LGEDKMEYNAKCGDIFLCDSDRTGAKIVKFFMTAPTVWQYIWRGIKQTQEVVRYYHAGMILSKEQMIEQQSKVQYGETNKILTRRISIYRKKSLTSEQQDLLRERAIAQLGQGYGVEDVIAHTITWLTGIRLFTYIIGAFSRNRNICVNRVARWYNHIDDFGTNKYEITTKIMDEYCQHYTKEWELVYQN
jgi:hypothetical protein